MSIDAIKQWLAEVDISHTDWRLRWPLMLLPFLMLGMLYCLFKASFLSGQLAASSVELQQDLQSDLVAVASTQVGPSAAESALLFRNNIGQYEDNARTLQQWLQQGRNTTNQAQHAAALVELTTKFRNSDATMPAVEFWNAISEVLADLENGVVNGIVTTPEARDLIERLRTQYAELRSTTLTTAPLDVGAEQTENSASEKQALLKNVSAGFAQLREQRAVVKSLQNRALILAALSSLMLGLLMWGMWRSSKTRQTASAGKTRSEQGAILRLLDEISPLAQGDLRVKATVSEASTGAVADAFNFAVDELRRLVMAVTDSAELVKKSVSENRESANELAQASSVQSREIHRSSNYLNVMSDTMAQLSEHAVESSRIADLSVQQARAGKVAVKANVDGLSRIRDQAEMTTRLMQRLVETSQTINEHVKDIQQVAQRTDLLALNTTIRSASQISTSGSDTVTQLSHDVSHLAETLGQASRDIASLSELIQQDARITLASMANTVDAVDDSQMTAERAQKNLTEIDIVSNKLNQLIGHIASKSLRQAGVVKQLSANMTVINNITHDSTTELQASAQSLELLQDMTTELRNSVSDFKLPREEKPQRVKKKIARHSVTHA